eukprot:NODE_12499_length_1221_cov_5.852834.p1 GENE.NODE_12499_length_1221_cov_5.852834~~NODE_12499_length_1221_cov_5.852834.p1  ORF type:complete len:283 (+),score=81.77 NODE_12499_length_1221_cov_5.852834:95-943(+)
MVTKEMGRQMPALHTPEMTALRSYITANDATRFDGMAEGMLRLDVSHSNLQQRWHDVRFSVDMSVLSVKEKLYRHGGTPAQHQELYLRRGGGDTIFLMDDAKTLAYYGTLSGMEIHIKDTDPYSLSKGGGLEDVSQVEKYVLPDDEYDKMKNTVRAKRREEEARKKMQQVAVAAAAVEEGAPEESLEELAAVYALGSRCEVDPGGRRGEVCYVGAISKAPGFWIGARLDEPFGKSDGTKDGIRYFECRPKYGCFVRSDSVRVGDFPERDPFASDCEEGDDAF